MARATYKRCNLTLDLTTIRKCKELADEKGQSVFRSGSVVGVSSP